LKNKKITSYFLAASLGVLSVVLPSLYVCAQLPKLDKKNSLQNMNEVDISKMVQPVPKSNQFIDSAYNIWCGSVIKVKNKYYMFYSRWPKASGHEAWITHSEIALASSNKPEGPYQHVKVIFKQRGKEYWDGICTHNPAVIYNKGKYYLYYMGTTGTAPITPNFAYSKAWYNYRNNQRIGVAVANHPEATWKRFDKPLLDVSKDSTAYDAMMVSNPAVTIDAKGKFILVYKQVEKNGTYQGGKVRFGVAFSNRANGPFIKHKSPILENTNPSAIKAWMIAEDPFIWNYKGTNYAIVRDVIGTFTGEEGALALLSSSNAIDWKPTKYPKVIANEVYDEHGKKLDDKLERPWLLMQKGLPVYLYGAMGINRRYHSMNIAVPLQSN
jgi:predicted GH43/DUF377 family glycosyl hydrolase